ncbi:MAG TPA: hypothetical protein VJG13_06115, partial [Thermoanaerobaculia bacterium]|nr:hypothetical protein [Thermoanaerobaculia bacterium]
MPDVDVILEQIPGGVVAECSPPNCPDRWVIDLTKDFAAAMSPVNLPEGWTFAVDGKQVVLEGPAPDRPTRFRFDAGEAKRPEKISYRASLDGRTLVDTKNLKVTPVAPRQQIGSLQGIVTMPTQVAPGEPMKMQVSEAANLPPGGMWSLSGTVVDEEEREDPEETTAKEPKRRVALAVPPGQDVLDEALDDIAAVLLAQGVPAGSWEVVPVSADEAWLDETREVWTVTGDPESTTTTVARETVSSIKQLMQQQIIPEERTGKIGGGGLGGGAVYSVRPMDVGGAPAGPVIVVASIAVDEEDIPVDDSPPRIIIDQKSINIT